MRQEREGKAAKLVIALVVLVGLLSVTVYGLFFWRDGGEKFAGEALPITLGVPPNEQSGLIFIAESQGFFKKNGLDATVKIYDSALAALDGMKKGEVDVSQSAAFPVITEAFKKEKIGMVAGIDEFQNMFLAFSKDRGIAKPADLKGKKIGAAKGTATEFFLGRFLELNGVREEDVEFVYMKFPESAEALASGTVDAFQVQNKDLPKIKEKLGENMSYWPSQSNQPAFEILAGRNDWIAGHPDVIFRLLNALFEAEKYYTENPDKVLKIVQEKLKYDDAYMATIGPQHTYSLSLEQSLVLAMEDQARWMIRRGRTTEKDVPHFLDYISEAGLKAVKPEAVNIIR